MNEHPEKKIGKQIWWVNAYYMITGITEDKKYYQIQTTLKTHIIAVDNEFIEWLD